MSDDFEIQDESGDHKYFTIVPNYILNHSTMWDREVYIQMKRIAGDRGKCWASRATLAKQCGMSVRRLDKCLKYLLEHDWIRKVGSRKVEGAGGLQPVCEYQMIDLWKKNIAFYEEGGAGGALPSSKGVQEVRRGGAGGAHKEEPSKKNHLVASATEVIEVRESDSDAPSKRIKKVTPAMQEVFDLFSENPARFQWKLYESERVAAEVLHREFGIDELLKRYAVARSYRGSEMCPVITKPSNFLEKMPNMELFLKQVQI